jgi:hypothetical protein
VRDTRFGDDPDQALEAWRGPRTRFLRFWFGPGGTFRVASFDDPADAASAEDAAVALEAAFVGDVNFEIDGFGTGGNDARFVVASATIERCE